MSRLTEAEVLTMLEGVFNEPAGSLTPGTARDDLPGWDSMGALLLMAELDERFGIVLTPEQSKTMTRIVDVLDLLRTNNALQE